MSEIFSLFTVWDAALWLAGSSLIMLVASEVLSPYVSRRNILLEVRKIRTLAILFAIAFIFTVVIKVVSITTQ
jgi:hypothetical protein